MIGDISMDRLVLLFDALTAILLLATIAYAAILHRRLSVLRESRQEMEQLMDRFTEASATAQTVLAELRQAAGDSGQALQQSIAQGNALADDLMFLVDRAGGMAKRLEGVEKPPEQRRRTGTGPAKSPGPRSVGAARPKDAEVQPTAAAGAAQNSDFMKALRGLR